MKNSAHERVPEFYFWMRALVNGIRVVSGTQLLPRPLSVNEAVEKSAGGPSHDARQKLVSHCVDTFLSKAVTMAPSKVCPSSHADVDAALIEWARNMRAPEDLALELFRSKVVRATWQVRRGGGVERPYKRTPGKVMNDYLLLVPAGPQVIE